MEGITLQAIFVKATTTVDGGWRLTFDIAQNESGQIIDLAILRDQLLQLAIVPLGGK